jgi:hypothetical protein
MNFFKTLLRNFGIYGSDSRQISWEELERGKHTYAKQESESVIGRLPGELLLEIFKYLDIREPVIMMVVSKDWNAVASSPCLWKLFLTPFYRKRVIELSKFNTEDRECLSRLGYIDSENIIKSIKNRPYILKVEHMHSLSSKRYAEWDKPFNDNDLNSGPFESFRAFERMRLIRRYAEMSAQNLSAILAHPDYRRALLDSKDSYLPRLLRREDNNDSLKKEAILFILNNPELWELLRKEFLKVDYFHLNIDNKLRFLEWCKTVATQATEEVSLSLLQYEGIIRESISTYGSEGGLKELQDWWDEYVSYVRDNESRCEALIQSTLAP